MKKKLTEEHKRKIALAHTGKKRAPFSEEWRRKLGQASLGNHYRAGKTLTDDHKKKISAYMNGKKHADHSVTVKRILEECAELERQGFRAIPVGWRIIPDIIAIKDNKVFAVEVEYGKPNYSKYTPEIQAFYDDVIWLIRKKWKNKYTKESA